MLNKCAVNSCEYYRYLDTLLKKKPMLTYVEGGRLLVAFTNKGWGWKERYA